MKQQEYNFIQIQNKHKKNWYDNNLYKAIDFDSRPKKYVLAELPYPSGPFLHMGHMLRYTVPDVKSRYYRMKGYNVLFPMGWDCFGLPAETYAIKVGTTPQKALAEVIPKYADSLKTMGYSIDWDREVNTSDPKYYKWTQWMFAELFKQGLIEKVKMPMWWCDELGVLADEEVLSDDKSPTGKVSERGGYPVERRLQEQWVLKITKYADRLVEDLDQVNFMENVKKGQINWIGRSTGAKVKFKVGTNEVEVFTTRPDTIFGVTFMAISPEHPLINTLLNNVENKEDVEKYIERSKNLSDMERQTKEKTGIKCIGVDATHPLTGESIPLFIADYVLMDYGTGVVMGVPGHDDRDNEFATKYNVPIKVVVKNPETTAEESKGYTGVGEIINSNEYDGMNSNDFKKVIIKYLEDNSIGEKATTYKIRDQIFGRQRYWGEPMPIYIDAEGNTHLLELKDLPLELPEMDDFLPDEKGTSPLAKNTDWNTFSIDGNEYKRVTDTMPTWAGSNWYYIRYIDPKNDETFCDVDKMKYWLPVDEYYGDAGHTTAHLMYTRFWVKALHDAGHIPVSEPIDWRMSGGLLLGEDRRKMSKSRPEFMVNTVDLLGQYGADAARMTLCFLGPYDETYPYNPQSVKACFRVIDTIWESQYKVADNVKDKEVDIAINTLISNLDQMFNDLKMNTAVSEIMKFVNVIKNKTEIDSDIWKNFILCIAPITPFIAEELWQIKNGFTEWTIENSVHVQSFPTAKDIEVTSMNIPVQVNGKVRGVVIVSPNDTQDAIVQKALDIDSVKKFIESDPKKIIYVEGKILNLIV